MLNCPTRGRKFVRWRRPAEARRNESSDSAASLPSAGPSNRIAYTSDVSGHPEIYTINLDGTGAELLTDYETSEKTYRSDPAWSPDGRWVAFQEMRDGVFQLRAMRPAGGPVRPLTDDGQNEQPAWAPDSRHIVFTSTRSGVRQLWVLDAESSRVRQLTHGAGSRIAAWSPRLTIP